MAGYLERNDRHEVIHGDMNETHYRGYSVPAYTYVGSAADGKWNWVGLRDPCMPVRVEEKSNSRSNTVGIDWMTPVRFGLHETGHEWMMVRVLDRHQIRCCTAVEGLR
jgi:hypothetical protein